MYAFLTLFYSLYILNIVLLQLQLHVYRRIGEYISQELFYYLLFSTSGPVNYEGHVT